MERPAKPFTAALCKGVGPGFTTWLGNSQSFEPEFLYLKSPTSLLRMWHSSSQLAGLAVAFWSKATGHCPLAPDLSLPPPSR